MIRVAVVGTGGISHAHIHAWMKFPERCKIVALVDIIPGKAQRVKEQYHLDADVYLDHHDILNLDIDVVDVCTPPFSHAEISINALQSGKNVVCEKPMAASLQECDEMLKAPDKAQFFSQKFNIALPQNINTGYDAVQFMLNRGMLTQDQVNNAMKMSNHPIFQKFMNRGR